MKVTCDRCHKDFKVTFRTKQYQVDSEKIIETFFRCPYCLEVYDVTYDNSMTSQLKEQIKMETEKLKQTKDMKEYNKLYAKIYLLKNQLKRTIVLLQRKVKGE